MAPSLATRRRNGLVLAPMAMFSSRAKRSEATSSLQLGGTCQGRVGHPCERFAREEHQLHGVSGCVYIDELRVRRGVPPSPADEALW
jgi:hypothetical protein